MEFTQPREDNSPSTHTALIPINDNRGPARSGQGVFPADAVAHIFSPSRSVTTSKPARKVWKLVFEPRSPSYIDPLMGYTGSDDTLKQVELTFPSCDSAVRFAQRAGLRYLVHPSPHPRATPRRSSRIRLFSDATIDWFGLSMLRESYGCAGAVAANHNKTGHARRWVDPMDVVHDKNLSQDCKRSILMDWAWTEYLVDQATDEGMPENNRPSRLAEVEQALQALEQSGRDNDVPQHQRKVARGPAVIFDRTQRK